MVHYIKVRPHVARRLGVEDQRYRFADGNILIWDKELRKIDVGWVFHPEETVARIGGLLMDPYRCREEQMRTADECTPLPEPTDPAWATPEGEDDRVPDDVEEMPADNVADTGETPDTDVEIGVEGGAE